MNKILQDKKILVIDDDFTFNSLISSYLRSLGAVVITAEHGTAALNIIHKGYNPELIFCDLNMPQMSGAEFIAHINLQSPDIPVIVISATNKITDVDEVLRLGAKDILFKPVYQLEEIKNICLKYLHPKLFSSCALEKNQLAEYWASLQNNTDDVIQFLKQLHPPGQQILADYHIHYHQLCNVEQAALIFDIAEFSTNEIAFYCIDITRDAKSGPIVAMLLRVIFNDLLKKYIHNTHQRLPNMNLIFNKINKLLKSIGVEGQYPLLLGYYHTKNKTLLLSSAGMNAELSSDHNEIKINNTIPLGVLQTVHSNQICEHCIRFKCRLWNNHSQIRLSFTPNLRSEC